jgi:ABC-type nitrate/sulfonate/bicarbonate transport system ATPase subunit
MLMAPIIAIKSLEFAYLPHRPIIRIDTLEVQDGEFVLIIGPNESGKSTLCKVLAGILPPTRSEQFNLPNPRPVLVWQEQELFPLSVENNLRIVCADGARVDELISQFHLSHERRAYPWELSGGTRERPAIARGLAAGGRRVMIFDEPTQSLDTSFVDDVAGWVLDVVGMKIATVVVTHDERFVALLSRGKPSVYMMEQQLDAATGTTISGMSGPFRLSTIFGAPESLYSARFAGYENIYEMVIPAAQVEWSNLWPLAAGGDPANLVAQEVRSGGLLVARYRRESGAGNKWMEVVMRWTQAGEPPASAWLTFDKARCIRIGP